MVVVLGVNAYHGDTSAALFVDGDLVAAAEEERFTRVKHDSGLPVSSVAWALQEAGLSLADVEHVAVSKNPHTHKARRTVRAAEHLARSRSFPASRLRAWNRIASVKEDISEALGAQANFEMHNVEHHPAHIASAFFASPFDDAAICSVDGLGDHVSMAWGTASGGHLELSHRVFFPHSMGFFYTAITQFLGFPHYGDEYKVMGLAPYGVPVYREAMRDILRAKSVDFSLNMKYFSHGNSMIDWNFEGGPPVLGAMFSQRMEDVLGPARQPEEPLTQRHRDIAASAQLRLEEVLLPILKRVQQHTGNPRLAMAGGVALNVTANTKICDTTGFREVYIPPAANDAGTSVGAGLYVMHEKLRRPRNFEMVHAYYGPAFSDDQCTTALEAAGLKYTWLGDDELASRTAALIADGNIVGWFQGRMEFGPRALGNRSIVCDPRRPDMKEILNSRTKRREAFRPFAPSILLERTEDVYDFSGSSPFMLMAPKVRREWAHRIPAVTHVDGTGRIQTVDRKTNPRYWELLSAFERLTGVPVVLNTSFNENEPIVCTPEEAVACFLRADMDVLVLGNCVVEPQQ
jgi:carbamoyltransferase